MYNSHKLNTSGSILPLALMPQKIQDLSKRHHNLNLTCNSSQFSNGVINAANLNFLHNEVASWFATKETILQGRWSAEAVPGCRKYHRACRWSSTDHLLTCTKTGTAQSQGLFICQMGSAMEPELAIATEGIRACKQT